jgi:DNA invertase Pin-like site-specific DNA recombinase
LIQSGGIDLVLTSDVSRISRNPVDMIDFLSHCVNCGTRFLSLGDRIDTADEDWQEALLSSFADDQEGGAA